MCDAEWRGASPAAPPSTPPRRAAKWRSEPSPPPSVPPPGTMALENPVRCSPLPSAAEHVAERIGLDTLVRVCRDIA